MQKIICLDPGKSHTGIAISSEGVLAQPFGTINEKRYPALTHKILNLILEEKPDSVVIGLPEFGPMVEFVNNLKVYLESKTNTPVILHSEMLSSKEASLKMSEMNKGFRALKNDSHAFAAALILQDYLDSL